MNFEILETSRLILRKLTPLVYNEIFSHFDDLEIIKILGIDRIEELETEKNKYKGGISTYNKSFVNFQIVERSSDEIIGQCGFHVWYMDHSRAEIGYKLREKSQGKGYMSEAIVKIVNYGFEELKLNRIEAFISPKNIPSLKLVERLGFVKEGLLRSHYCKDNAMEDSLIFGLLKQEYKEH